MDIGVEGTTIFA